MDNEKTALANKTNYTLIWYDFYDLPSARKPSGQNCYSPRDRTGAVIMLTL